VIYLPHNGKVLTINKISFVGLDFTTINLPSLNGPYIQVVFPLQHINYIETCPIPFTINENESLIICSTSYDPYLVVDMVISLMGLLDPNLPTPIVALDMYSFQSIVVSSNEYLLEYLIEVCTLTCIPYRSLSCWKP
jgi:hypothetical protein